MPSTISRTVQDLLAHKDEVILVLEKENMALRNENKALKKQIQFARGVPVEELIAKMTGGVRNARYKGSHDVVTKNGTRLEVKYSKVQIQSSTTTKRWIWDNILGENETKKFEHLVLVGENDQPHEYPDLPFVFFLVPRGDVGDVMGRGNCIALNTNLNSIRPNNHKAITLKGFLVHSQDEFERFKL